MIEVITDIALLVLIAVCAYDINRRIDRYKDLIDRQTHLAALHMNLITEMRERITALEKRK